MGRLRIPLLGQISLALAGVALLPLALASYRLVDLNREALTEQTLRTHAVAARTAAARVETILAGLRAAARSAALNPTVSSAPKSREAGEALAGLLATRPELSVLSLRANAAPGAETGELVKVRRRDLAEEIARVESTLADASDPRQPRFAFGTTRTWVALQTTTDEVGLAVDLVLEASPFLEALRPEALDEEAELVIAELANPRTLGGPRGKGPALSSFPPLLVTAAANGRISGSGRYRDEAGREVVGAFAPVVSTRWFVVSKQPVLLAESIVQRTRREALTATTLALGLAGLLAFFAYRSVLGPIRRLLRAQRALAGTSATRGNEIEQLTAAFSVLERRIRDSEDLGQVFLGRYQVLTVLGSGSMGTVFRGFDPKLRREVALKTVRLDASGKDSALAEMTNTLLHEATTVARFNHPNIVAVYDVQDLPSAAFLAMEFVDGLSLERLLSKERRLPLSQVGPLGIAIARALGAAHRHGVVHQDIKPGNILLGKDGAIKVGDFGIARLVSSRGPVDTVFGTPGYLPPESLTGQSHEPRGDLFALGVVLYECLVGERPFEGDTLREVLASTLGRRVPIVRDKRKDVPKELSELVERLLAKVPEARPDTAQEVEEILTRLSTALNWHWQAPSISGNEPSESWNDSKDRDTQKTHGEAQGRTLRLR